MPRGRLTKVDVLSKIFKMKDRHQKRQDLSTEMKYGYDIALNDVLNFLNEFSQ